MFTSLGPSALLLFVILFTSAATVSPLALPVSAGIDIGTSGCRISLITAPDDVIYSKSVLFSEISSDPNAYRDPSTWLEGLNRLIVDLPEIPSSLSLSSTSNSLLHVDRRTYAPISVSMYDASYLDMLASEVRIPFDA